MSQRCSAKNRNEKRCGAWAVTGGNKCALHLDPGLAAKMGSKHGRRTTFPPARDASGLAHRSLKSIGDVSDLLEETINRVRRGPFDLPAANAIGFLASTLLKALDQRLEDRLAHLEAVICGKGETEAEVFEFRPAKESHNEESSTARQGD
jgi:hypothetical protein